VKFGGSNKETDEMGDECERSSWSPTVSSRSWAAAATDGARKARHVAAIVASCMGVRMQLEPEMITWIFGLMRANRCPERRA
jgi:hypothetical protein